MTRGNSGRTRRTIVLLAGAAVLALPSNAFACWNLCVQTNGYYRYMYQTWWELSYCTESWADGASSSTTTCYYQRYFEDFE